MSQANLGWTVEQLKKHLSDSHPAKPPLAEQKLVYSGRLLENHLRLRDVLRRFEPGQAQTMHIIVTGGAFERTVAMRNASGHGPISRSVSADEAPAFASNGAAAGGTTDSGLRRRHPAGGARTAALPTTPSSTNPPPASNGMGSAPPTASTSAVSPGGYVPSSPGATAIQRQQWHATAFYLAQYAQQLAAAGYPPQMVEPYVAQSKYYWNASQQQGVGAVVAVVPPSQLSTVGSPASLAAVPSTTHTAAAAASAATFLPAAPQQQQQQQHGPGLDGAVEPPPVAVAAAGGGPEDEGDRAELADGDETWAARLVNNFFLALKLAVFVFYFGAHAKGFRLVLIYILCAATFVWQGGWIRRAPAPAVPVAAPAPAPAVDVGAAGGGEGGGRGQPGEEGPAVPGEAGGVSDAAADADGAQQQQQQQRDEIDPLSEPALFAPQPSLPRLSGTLVFRFFSSLVPAGVPDEFGPV
jgi:hypothetical protein